MKKCKLFLVLTLVFAFVCSTAHFIMTAYSKSTDSADAALHYDYPIVPGTQEWENLSTHEDMLNAVQVPEALLKEMSTEEVVTTVLENPMIIDIYAYETVGDGYKKGYDTLRKNLNCVEELANRPDAVKCLSKALQNMNARISKTNDSEKKNDLESQKLTGKKILQCMKNTQ